MLHPNWIGVLVLVLIITSMSVISHLEGHGTL